MATDDSGVVQKASPKGNRSRCAVLGPGDLSGRVVKVERKAASKLGRVGVYYRYSASIVQGLERHKKRRRCAIISTTRRLLEACINSREILLRLADKKYERRPHSRRCMNDVHIRLIDEERQQRRVSHLIGFVSMWDGSPKDRP